MEPPSPQPPQPTSSTSSQPSPPLFSDPPASQPPPPQQQIPNTNPNHTLNSYPQQSPQNPNPNPNPNRSITLTSYTQPPQQPPQLNDNNNNRGGGVPLTRSWSHSQPTSQFSHFPPSTTSSSTTTSTTTTSSQLGFAIGVPAVSSQPAFSSSFGAPFGGGGGGGGGGGVRNLSDASFVSSSPSQARATMQGMSGMGIMGSQIRPGGVAPSALHPQRPVQTTSTIRPQAVSSNLSSIPQNFQGHGILRAPSINTPTTSTSNTSQGHQPWLSAPHVRPPLPSQPPLRPPLNSQSLQTRSQQPPQQPPQPLHPPSQPQHHLPPPNQSQDNFGQQRVSQPLANQPALGSFPRVQGATNQRPPVPLPPSVNHSGPTDALNASNALETSEQCNTILSKRNIRELVNQIDPSEKLDPDVEDVLVDIAEDFIDSVTTFGCSLAKHRKSNTLEAKDILLHLERTWNMTLPGFSGDEIKTFKKPVANDIHKERITLIKKSLAGGETGNTKPSVGQTTGNVKGHLAKASTNVVGS